MILTARYISMLTIGDTSPAAYSDTISAFARKRRLSPRMRDCCNDGRMPPALMGNSQEEGKMASACIVASCSHSTPRLAIDTPLSQLQPSVRHALSLSIRTAYFQGSSPALLRREIEVLMRPCCGARSFTLPSHALIWLSRQSSLLMPGHDRFSAI